MILLDAVRLRCSACFGKFCGKWRFRCLGHLFFSLSPVVRAAVGKKKKRKNSLREGALLCVLSTRGRPYTHAPHTVRDVKLDQQRSQAILGHEEPKINMHLVYINTRTGRTCMRFASING